jgi:pectinesterase
MRASHHTGPAEARPFFLEIWNVPILCALALAGAAHAGAVVRATGQSFGTVQAAVDALPDNGGEIAVEPGVYREKLIIAKRGVWLRGLGRRPQDVVIVWGDSSASVGGTIKSASVTVTGDNFRAENLTIQNDWSLHDARQSQAVALSARGDRAVFRRVRLLGAQDTLHTGTSCQAPAGCGVSRQYFRDCYIEGHVDFIFGDSNAFFDRCVIHAIAAAEAMLTAHRDETPDMDRAYVFDRCRITADENAKQVWLGRPWRDYARTIFMNTQIDARVEPAGWREWTPGATNRLRTAYYAEYRSRGRGARPKQRDPHSHQLTKAESQRWQADAFLRGADGWAPHKEK